MKEVLEFLKEANIYYIGTINNDCPEIRPFSTIHEFENKLYFQTGKSKEVYKQMKENSNITICAMNKGKWIRIKAKAIEDERIEASESLLNEYSSLKDKYKAGDGNCIVFYLEDAQATIYSFSDEPNVIKF